jgi:hypothetical protein
MNDSDCHTATGVEKWLETLASNGISIYRAESLSENGELDRIMISKQLIRCYNSLASSTPTIGNVQISLYLIRRRSHPSDRNDL